MNVVENANTISIKTANGYAIIQQASIIQIGLAIAITAPSMKVGNNGHFYK